MALLVVVVFSPIGFGTELSVLLSDNIEGAEDFVTFILLLSTILDVEDIEGTFILGFKLCELLLFSLNSIMLLLGTSVERILLPLLVMLLKVLLLLLLLLILVLERVTVVVVIGVGSVVFIRLYSLAASATAATAFAVAELFVFVFIKFFTMLLKVVLLFVELEAVRMVDLLIDRVLLLILLLLLLMKLLAVAVFRVVLIFERSTTRLLAVVGVVAVVLFC